MELSHSQEKIVNALRENHLHGLGFNALKRKTGLHSKVLQENLKKLVPEVVTKDKAGVERWQSTNYKLTIDPDFIKIIERSFAEIDEFEKKGTEISDRKSVTDVIRKGEAYTTKEIATLLNISHASARQRLLRHLEKGEVVRKKLHGKSFWALC